MMSTIPTTLDCEPRSRFTLVYGNRTADSTMFDAEIRAWEERYGERLVVHRVLSREPGAALAGRISPALVTSLVPDAADVDAWFLCGPQEMVDDVRGALAPTARGQVLSEVFPLAEAESAVYVEITSQVIVSVGGVESTFELASTGESILDAALQAGIDPPYSCAGGACGTCRAKVLLGKAVMDQNHALDDAEVADGYVLTCQAHPVSEEVRVDYDA